MNEVDIFFFYKPIIPLGLNFIPTIGGVSAGRGGFSLRVGRRSLTGWTYFFRYHVIHSGLLTGWGKKRIEFNSLSNHDSTFARNRTAIHFDDIHSGG